MRPNDHRSINRFGNRLCGYALSHHLSTTRPWTAPKRLPSKTERCKVNAQATKTNEKYGVPLGCLSFPSPSVGGICFSLQKSLQDEFEEHRCHDDRGEPIAVKVVYLVPAAGVGGGLDGSALCGRIAQGCCLGALTGLDRFPISSQILGWSVTLSSARVGLVKSNRSKSNLSPMEK